MLNSLKSLKRMKLMAFLIMLQLAIGLALVNSTAVIIDENNKKLGYLENLFDFENTYMVNIIRDYDNDSSLAEQYLDEDNGTIMMSNELDALYKLSGDLDELKEKSILINKNIYFCSGTPQINGIESIKTNYSDLEGSQQSEYTTKINVNYDFINRYDLKIAKGRNFTKEDFDIDYKTQTIPIIVGLEYEEQISIGDKFKGQVLTGKLINENSKPQMDIADVTYEVIGFYSHNAIPSVKVTNEIIRNMKYSDAFTLVPTVKGLAYVNESTCISDGGLFLEVSDYNYITYIENKFKDELKNHNLSMQFISLKDEFLAYKQTFVKDVMNSLLLGSTLIFLSIVGITSVLLGELSKRKKEFGVRIASGATIMKLCKEIILEILWLVVFSTILSLIILSIKSIGIEGGSIITSNLLVVDVLIVTVLTLIISTIPIIKISKMNPVDMLRGK